MAVLGFDTATKMLAVGLKKDGRTTEINILAERKHLELIFIKTQELLDRTNTDIKNLQAVACGIGPGSFIGSRIGVVAAKTIAQVLDIPLIGIPTLDIIAAADAGDLLVASDAMRGEIFYAFYKKSTRKGDISVAKPAELKEKIKCKKITIAGDAIEKYPELFVGHKRNKILYPEGKYLVELAYEKLQKKEFEDHFSLVPLYVREVDARESFIECKR